MRPSWRTPSPGWAPGWATVLAISLLCHPPAPLPAEAANEVEPPESTVPRGLLVISASDFEGMPLKDVTFEAVLAESEDPQSFTTNARGEVEIPDVADPGSIVVTLSDERYISPAPHVVINPSATISAWRLYQRNLSGMDRDEREEFARAFQEIVRHSSGIQPLLSEKVRTLAAFLTGGDRGSTNPTSPETTVGEEDTRGVLSVRLIDGRGAPQSGSLVQLYSNQPSTSSVLMVDFERTNEDGIAVFVDLELGRYYRAEVIEDREMVARSTIARLDGADPMVLPTMILRPATQTISGIVVDSEDVAAGTLITAQSASDGLMMTAATDRSGFFLLGPFASRDLVTLTFEQSTSLGVRTGILEARPGEGELLVPLHILSSD